MRIGELAQRTGVSVRSLRYYEETGLLTPVRRPSGYREYREDDIRTVRAIRVMLAAGLGTGTIAELLPCMVDDGQVLAAACSGLLPDLNRERERINDAVAELLAARDVLDSIIDATAPTSGNGADACRASSW
ncbi:MerR family transcriptional regulator [Streptoalloteichus hindustanus]|uniref:DNA-binding transcriptional regulator, MerR family n=1 Tax=Streptoalloteichus hindustanus TaxID=2017 RepID=A0A1M5F6P4_STRHI|nr:MerR family transcriptional regulator [Streptoalloteichus hindustanus]SHF86722.1 DNA-binding transcriptional regulator, MerR family [Streptoalloteichus hindustanus]